jgi:hypothetical protein
MPFSLAIMDEVKGVGDWSGLQRVGMFWAFGVELERSPLDDPRVGAVAPWRQAEVGDLGEQVRQEAVEKKGEAVGEARAR